MRKVLALAAGLFLCGCYDDGYYPTTTTRYVYYNRPVQTRVVYVPRYTIPGYVHRDVFPRSAPSYRRR